MSKNKCVPKELQKYVVVIKNTKDSDYICRYFSSQREALTWAKENKGKIRLFKINYDFYGDIK